MSQHGDINIEHVMWVVAIDDEYYYVLIDWGYVVLNKIHDHSIFQKKSSTSILQEGRLFPTFNVESLVYLFFFVCRRTFVLSILILIESTSKDKSIVRMSLCE
jgi:hypothetical protein